jgi:hypothetical protein
MSDLFGALKSDLLERRMLSFLLVLVCVLAGVLAYAVFGSRSSTEPPPAPVAAVRAPASAGASLAVSQAPASPNAAISETTDGTRFQHHGGAHNPFTPLTSPKSESSSEASSSASTTASKPATAATGSTTSGSSTGSAGPTTPTTPSSPTTPSTPRKPKSQPVYIVSGLFGLAPTTPGELTQLTPFQNLKRLEPLPSASDPRIVFAGVADDGKGAIFALAGEAILKGEASCLPSATQCEAVDLAAGQTEEFGELEASGLTVTYELKVLSVTKRQASAARAAKLNRRDRAGQALLRRLSPSIFHHLRFSSAKSVLVFVAHHGA